MAVAEPRAIRWSREEYHDLAASGFFRDRRVELIRGEIIEMTPQESPHATAVGLGGDALRGVAPEGFFVRDQSPLALGLDSEPEPDLAVVRGKRRDFLAGHPTSALLVVEVADTSLAHDRGPKASLYAEAGIPEYWIVNLPERRLEVRRAPRKTADGFSYAETRVYSPGESVACASLPGVVVRVADLLP